jgi:hypothetical protein
VGPWLSCARLSLHHHLSAAREEAMQQEEKIRNPHVSFTPSWPVKPAVAPVRPGCV